MKIKVPKEIKVGCFTYKVYLDESQDEGEYHGTTLHRKEHIRMNPHVSPTTRNVCLLHEFVHVLAKIYRVDPPERDIELLAQGFGEFLFNNLGVEFDWSDIPKLEPKEVESGD